MDWCPSCNQLCNMSYTRSIYYGFKHNSRNFWGIHSGAVAGGPGGHGPPIVETRPKIVNVVGNCRKIVKAVDGVGGGGEDLKCCPENILVCPKTFFGLSEKYCPWLPKNMSPTAPLGIQSIFVFVYPNYIGWTEKCTLPNSLFAYCPAIV
jgi:hypothetical protein